MNDLIRKLLGTPLSLMGNLELEVTLQQIRDHAEATALDRYCRGNFGAPGIPPPGEENWFTIFHFMTMAEEYLKGTAS